MEDLKKVRQLFRSPALSNVVRWSKCVHGRVIAICILNVANVFCSLGLTLVTKELIDSAVSSQWNDLMRYGIMLVALVLGELLLGIASSMTRVKASARLQRSLQSMLIGTVLKKQYANLKKYHSGELVNRLFSDMNTIKSGVLGILPSVISITVSFVGAAAILIALDWRFVMLLAAAGAVGAVILLLFRKPMKTRYKRMQKASDRLHAVIQETFENIRLIKASISENRAMKQIGMRQESMEKEQVRQGRFSVVMNNSMGMMFDFSWLFCMLWGCAAIFRGELTYGSLGAMIQLIGRVQGPIASAVSIASEAYQVIASAERLMDLTELPDEDPGTELQDFDEILLEDVSFRYDDGTEDVMHGVSGSIRKGDFVALTGTSGGGKTSLFQLLLGIYRPNSGRVVFRAGTQEATASRGTRSLFAYVPQGNTLFSGTLRENLTMFTDEATDDEIRAAARVACIDDVVDEIGLDAELAERGVGLSEGQAQRVAVARALLSKAPILLLDESTSALDEETEARMLANISALRDKTCLIVTHRRAALAICDYRLHMSEGSMSRESAVIPEN